MLLRIILLLFILVLNTQSVLFAQGLFDNRDSIISSISNPLFFCKIEKNIKDSKENSLLISTIVSVQDIRPVYVLLFFDEADICIKFIRFLPNDLFEGRLQLYKIKPSNMLINLEHLGIKYAWYEYSDKKTVSYFDPILSNKLIGYFAISSEPSDIFNINKK